MRSFCFIAGKALTKSFFCGEACSMLFFSSCCMGCPLITSGALSPCLLLHYVEQPQLSYILQTEFPWKKFLFPQGRRTYAEAKMSGISSYGRGRYGRCGTSVGRLFAGFGAAGSLACGNGLFPGGVGLAPQLICGTSGKA